MATTFEPPAPYRWRWLAFSAVLATCVMDLLDATVINVAAPAIREDLGGSYSSLQWMAAGYTLALAVMLLTGGRLGDMFGRRRMLLIGVAGFSLTSLACGTAFSPETLVASRVAQGLFGAMMLPQCFGLIRDLFPPAEMKKAWGAFGPVMGLSTVLGPVVAGFLIKADLFGSGWRAIFLINLPVGAYAFFVARRYVPAVAPAARGSRLDLPGVLLAATGMFMLVFPLVQGRELGWPLWVRAMLAAAVLVLTGFAWYQIRRKRAGAMPLIETSVFRKRSYASGVAFTIVFMGALGGVMLAVGLLLQVGLGYTPMSASLAMTPWAIGAVIGSGFGGAMMHKLGRKILHIGLPLMAAGLAGLYVAVEVAGTGVGGWHLLGPNLVGGVGMGMIFVPLFDIVVGEVEDHEVGSASSLLNATNQLAVSLGVAILGTVFFGVMGAQAHDNFDSAAAPKLRAELAAAGVPAQEQIVAGARDCVHDRENQTDPDAVPSSCRAAGSDAAVMKAVKAAAGETHERDSLGAVKVTVLVTIGLVAVAFAIGFLLPKQAREEQDAESAGQDGDKADLGGAERTATQDLVPVLV